MKIPESDIIDITSKEFPELISTIEDGIKALIIVGGKLAQKTFEIKTKKSQLALFLYSDIVETINASYNLCLQGYYECVARLLRYSFEASFTIQKLDSYKEESFEKSKISVTECEAEDYNKFSDEEREIFEISLWLDSNNENSIKKKISFMKIFSSTGMIKKFSEPDFLEENLEAYHKLSQFTHPSYSGIKSRLLIKRGFIKLSPVYEREFTENLLKDILKIIMISGNFLKKYTDFEFSTEEQNLIASVGKRYDNLI